MGFAGEALNIALGVAFVEGDGNAATNRFGKPCVYADAVGDLDLLDKPLDPKNPDGPKVSSKYGPSLSHFQIRALRDPNAWGVLDRWRVATKLVNAEAPGAAARYATQAAFALSKQGTDFTPWSAFKSNSYLLYAGRDFDLVTGHPRAGDWSK